MKDTCFLVMNGRGITRMTKSRPALNGNEVAVRLAVQVSDKFFARFMPEAALVVSDDRVMQPEVTVDTVAADEGDKKKGK